MQLPVYSRADLSRTIAPVVALFLAAVWTSAVAREFRAADSQNEDYPTVQALRYMGRMVAERSGGRHQIRVFHSRQLGEEKETIEQTRAGDERAGDAVSVSLHGAFTESAGRADRQRNPEQFPTLWLCRPGVLRFRGAIDLQQRQAGALDRRHQGLAAPPAKIRIDVRHDQGTRRGADRAALWASSHRAFHSVDRRRGEQLALLCHVRSLQICRLLHPHRALDVTGSAGDVAESLGKPVGGGPNDFSRSRDTVQSLHARQVEGSRAAVAAAGGGRGGHDRHRFRPQAFRSRDGRNLPKSATRSRRRGTDRANSQGGVSWSWVVHASATKLRNGRRASPRAAGFASSGYCARCRSAGASCRLRR